MVQGNRLPRGP